MLQTGGWRRGAVALAIALGSILILACSDEPAPAAEAEGNPGGSAPDPAVAAEPLQPEENSSAGAPGLADKVRSLIAESDDAAAAYNALMLFYSAGLSEYAMDDAGIIEVGREYLEAGDTTMADIVISFLQLAATQATGEVSADVWAAQGDVRLAQGDTERAQDSYEVALNTDPNHTYSKGQLAALTSGQSPQPAGAASSQGANREAKNRLSPGRRDDLARFRFEYQEDGTDRTLLISETCYNSGVLRAVAQWEDDADPWVFESVSEAVFEQVNAPAGAKPVRLEFQLHPGHGGIQGLTVSGGAKGQFEQAGYIPDGFEPEIGTCD